jgi:MSHA pilin protein MshC
MRLCNRGSGRGFTLVELVLAIVIAGVIAVVAVPRMADRSAFQTRGGASELRTALRYAQRLAMAKNREVCVTTTASDLTLMFNPSLTAGQPCIPVIRPDDGSNYVLTLPAGIALTPVTTFRFDGQGRPSVTPVSLTVGGTITVTVERETGYVQ